MQRHKKLTARLLSLVLSIVMVTTMTSATVFATGGDVPLGRSSVSVISGIGTIQSFDKLDDRFEPSTGEGAADHIYGLAVGLHTPAEDLQLPAALDATVERAAVQDSGTAAAKESVAVTWQSDKEYVSDENGKFVYTAVLPEGYILAEGVSLPQIYVLVGRQARSNTRAAQRTEPLDLTLISSNNTMGAEDLSGTYLHLTEGWSYILSPPTLYLNGVDFNVPSGKAIITNANMTTTITLQAGTTNTITAGTAIFANGNNCAIAIDTEDIANPGLLSVVGKTGPAIENVNNSITVKSGTINCTTEQDNTNALKAPKITLMGGSTNVKALSGSSPFSVQPTTENAVTRTSDADWNNSTGDEVTYEEVEASGETITIDVNNGTTGSGATLEAAITASTVAATDVTSLKITAGEVTTADWNYLVSLNALENFEIEAAIANDKVANIPKGIEYASTFPASIKTVTVPQAITIGESAFKGTALTSASFSAATSIDAQAFADCASLANASFSAVTDIKWGAFSNCTALTTLKLGATPPTLGANVFYGCLDTRALGYVDAEGNDLAGGALADAITAYKTVADADDASKWHGWTIEAPKISLTATIGGVETTLSGDSLENALTGKDLTKVTSLKITAGAVTEADWNYLKNLSAMTTFEIASGVTAANMPDGRTDAPIFPASIVTVTVPQAITIGECAFAVCTALTTVGFPAATGIGAGAFIGCTSLTSASFPAVTSIGYQTFYYCAALTTASFPAVESINMSAFSGCSALATLKLGATQPTVGDNAFKDCLDIRALGYVDANGTALTGDALEGAIENYKNDPTTGAVADGKWYGWTIEPPPVASIDDTTYPTLQAAVDAIVDGQTIKVLEDITEAGVKREIPSSASVDSRFTIDLNGFDVTLTGTKENINGLSVTNSNSKKERLLTLTDNSSGEAGTLTATGYPGTGSDSSSNGIYTNNLTVSRVTLVANGGGPKASAGIYLTSSGAVCTIEDGAVVTAKTEKTTTDSWGIFSAGGKIIVDDAVLYAISPADAYSEGHNCATCVQPEDAQGTKLNPDEDPTNSDGWKRLVATYGAVKVTDITGVPTSATAGTDLTLAGTVAPTDATNKDIVWSVKDAGTTGATISGNVLTTTAAGTVVVTATIANGLTASSDYTKDFDITVNSASSYKPVTDITGVPTSATAGTDLTLAGTVAPADATNKTIVWSVKDAGATGATIDGGKLKTTAAGTVVVTATITNGLTASSDYTKDFTITVYPVGTVLYTITFNANGGSVSPATATTDAAGKLSGLPTPTRSGYTFNGWFTAASGGTAVTTTTVFTQDSTVYAQWTQNSGGGGGGSSSPAPSNTIYSAEGSKGASNVISQAIKNAIATGGTNVSTSATFNNFDFLALDGLKTINEIAAKESAGKTVNFTVNFDAGPKEPVNSRITVDPAALAKELTAKNITGKLPLGVWFDQTKDTKVQSVNTLFGKHFSNKIVSVVYDRNSTLAVNAEFCAKLNLAETFGTDKNLYFYTYDNTTNIYKRILLPNYRVDKNGYAHITAPFGGSIIISDKPLTKR